MLRAAHPGRRYRVHLAETLRLAAEGDKSRTAIMVFPELGLSSYAIEDLLLQDALLDQVEESIARIVAASNHLFPVLIVGAPLRLAGRLYNTAVVIHRGAILGVVPKTYLPNYREFYEKRHFVSGRQHRRAAHQARRPGRAVRDRHAVPLDGQRARDLPCRDLRGHLGAGPALEPCGALAGAEVLVNLSASNITIGKAEARRLLCGSQSSRGIAAYAYSASGPGESTTDLAWDGHAAIYECGDQLVESARFEKESTIVRADVDLGRIRQERLRNNGFADCAFNEGEKVTRFRKVDFVLDAPRNSVALERAIERFPYVPSDPARLRDNCYEAYNIQVQGLAQRLMTSRTERAIIGVSGGLDSTHALIVTCRAMDQLGLPRKNVMPIRCPASARPTRRTRTPGG